MRISYWRSDVCSSDLINEKALADLHGTDRITTRRCDVLDWESVRALAKETGAPDIFFNCAGYVAMGNLLQCTEKEWELPDRKSVVRGKRVAGRVDIGGRRIVK